MTSEKSHDLIRKGFIFAAAIGLVINVLFDFLSYSKNHRAERLGEFVAQSYASSLHLERLDRLLHLPKSEEQKNQIQTELQNLKNLQSTLPASISVAELSQQINQSDAKAVATISHWRDILDLDLIQRQKASNKFNFSADHGMLEALIFDLFLIVLMLTFFIISLNAKKEIELNLKSSLLNLRQSITALEEQALRLQVEAKTAVHDLKNPIGTIIGFTELLNDAPDQIPVTEFSNRIRRISERTLSLVESLLAKDPGNGVAMKEVDVISLAKDLCSQLEVLAEKKQQKIQCHFQMPKATILGNSLKLEELMANILSNAIKYSPLKSKIRFSIGKANNQLRLQIEDQGPGFTEADIKNAFQYGQKLSAKPTANESSTGFGLYIAKQIVNLHHGDIQITTPPSGHGACVVIDFPLPQ